MFCSIRGKPISSRRARERLAKVAGILIAYPDIRVEIDGYTDSTGSLEFNERLSQQRAESVRSFLASQGVNSSSITTQGFGPSDPIASNDTAAGRQQNRRVELVVSGSSIGQAADQNASDQNASSGGAHQHAKSSSARAACDLNPDNRTGGAVDHTAEVTAIFCA